MPEPSLLPLYLADLRKLALHGGMGLGAGLLAATALQLTSGLYFWFEDQQQALGLIALTLALPLGAACGGAGRAELLRGLAAGIGLAFGCVALGGFLLQACSWFGAAALLGAALSGISRKAALPASLGWAALCALPFFFERLEAFPLGGHAREWSAQESPWLGFAQNVYSADPLHKTFLYFNQLSALSSATSIDPIDASRLWLLALIAMAGALFRARKPA
jgi:hypothetical protein